MIRSKNLPLVIFQYYFFLVEELFVSHCFYFRVKNKCSGQSSDMLPYTSYFEQRGFYLNNYRNYFRSNITIFDDVICTLDTFSHLWRTAKSRVPI
jgi:hypothetical protein